MGSKNKAKEKGVNKNLSFSLMERGMELKSTWTLESDSSFVDLVKIVDDDVLELTTG